MLIKVSSKEIILSYMEIMMQMLESTQKCNHIVAIGVSLLTNFS